MPAGRGAGHWVLDRVELEIWWMDGADAAQLHARRISPRGILQTGRLVILYAPLNVRRIASERGVTLIELMIAITLVAAISTGMLWRCAPAC